MRFLIVEDDPAIAQHIADGLASFGCDSDLARSGQDAITAFTCEKYSAVILDRMLPDISGVEVLGTLCQQRARPPVLMLSALGTVKDRIDGLNAGADDYLTKPFDMAELIARLNAIARRAAGQGNTAESSSSIKVGRLSLDPARHSARIDAAEIQLNRKLYSLLAHMMHNADRVVTRSMLIEHVWGYSFVPATNVVETNMSRLRSKLLELGRDPIETIRGTGYILRSQSCV